jgi:hypothetical protein
MPVVLGGGAPLLPLTTTRSTTLTSTTHYPSGAVGLTYTLT